MIKIKGLDEVRARLAALDLRVREQYALQAIEAGAQVIADAMRERAPERIEGPSGDALPVGALRHDIKVRGRLDKDDFAVAVIGPGKKTAHVARWVEYGHRLVRGRSAIGHVPAHPFLRPALEASEESAIDRFKSVLRALING